MGIANVNLTDTFDQWRLKTNQSILYQNQLNATMNLMFDTTNSSFEFANTTANNLANTAVAANNYSGKMANSSNGFAISVGASGNNYANVIGNSGNAYSVVIGSAGNAYINVSVSSVNAYANLISLSGNNYAGAMANSGNSWSNTVGISGNSYTNLSVLSANAYANLVSASSNGWANSVGVAANFYANQVGLSGNSYTNTSVASSNNYANASFYTIANGSAAFLIANAAFATANILSNGQAVSIQTNQSCYNQSNTQWFYINSAFALTNTSFGVINSAFTQSNTDNVRLTSLYNQHNLTFTITNSAYVMANANYVVTNAAFTLANGIAIGANNYAGFMANASNTYANNTFLKLVGGSISGDLTITGNLSFTGNAITIQSSTLSVGDSLIYLAANNYSGTDLVDIGFLGNYGNNTGKNVHSGFIRNHTDKQYYLFNGYDIEPGTNNQINFGSNNMVNAVLVADLNTSNLTLGGANTIVWIKSVYDLSNGTVTNAAASFAKANGVAGGANAYATTVGTSGNAYALSTATTVGTSGNAYANVVGTSGNAYANVVGTSGNAYALSTATTVGASANAYAAATYAPIAQGFYIGTTSYSINRGSASQTLTGINIDGNAAGTAKNITDYPLNQDVRTSASPTFSGLTCTAGYIYGSYISTNVSNAENPTVSQVMVTNGTDGFLRKSSISSFTSAVQGQASGTWSISVTGNSGTTSQTSWANLYTTSQLNCQGNQSGTLLTATGSLGGIMVQGPGTTNGAYISFHRPSSYATYFGLDTDNQFAIGGWSAGAALANMKVGSFGVGTAASGTAGEIRATNNITAYYSDIRLKTNITPISDALNKVKQISGVTFTNNDVAASYGYTDDIEQVGVIAQEIEKVLPQVIKPAPFDCINDENGNTISKSGENYKTVQYEKIVPLLIEAIKELSAQVDELKKGK